MRTLYIDIETSPAQAFVWGAFKQFISLDQIIEDPRILCFAARWAGEKRGVFYSEYEHGRKGMLEAAHRLLTEADVVVHYNGKRFDVPWLMGEFAVSGMSEPAPFQQLDLLATARKKFRFFSNKLDYVAKRFEVGTKVKHEGFGLWKACLAGDAKAWKRMEKYNRQDVDLLIDLHEALRPWLVAAPSYAAHAGEDLCPSCGSQDYTREGYAYTAQSTFQRFRCKPCGRWFRSTKRVEGVSVREIATT